MCYPAFGSTIRVLEREGGDWLYGGRLHGDRLPDWKFCGLSTGHFGGERAKSTTPTMTPIANRTRWTLSHPFNNDSGDRYQDRQAK